MVSMGEKMGTMSSYDPKVIIFSLINDKFRVIILWVTHIWFHFTGAKSYDREIVFTTELVVYGLNYEAQ